LTGEAFVAFRYPTTGTPLVTEVRSTMIVSAIQTLRARGLYDRYCATLSPGVRDPILSLIAGVWIPIDLTLEHYRAVDRLGLDPGIVESIGAEVADRINKSILSVAVSLSKRAGVTPWSALKTAHRVNDVNWKGGDIGVWRLGPKEAEYHWIGQPCASVPYFVTSFGGYLRALASLFCTKAYTRLSTERCSPTSLIYRISWV
jgi:hypothetical protein